MSNNERGDEMKASAAEDSSLPAPVPSASPSAPPHRRWSPSRASTASSAGRWRRPWSSRPIYSLGRAWSRFWHGKWPVSTTTSTLMAPFIFVLFSYGREEAIGRGLGGEPITGRVSARFGRDLIVPRRKSPSIQDSVKSRSVRVALIGQIFLWRHVLRITYVQQVFMTFINYDVITEYRHIQSI